MRRVLLAAALLGGAAGCGDEPLASHPWWRQPVNRRQVNHILSEIAALQAECDRAGRADDRLVTPDGRAHRMGRRRASDPGPARTAGSLFGQGEDTVIVFMAGRPGAPRLTRREARELLEGMLDRAHAAEAEAGRAAAKGGRHGGTGTKTPRRPRPPIHPAAGVRARGRPGKPGGPRRPATNTGRPSP
jgi:hypothetical protein